MNNISIVGRIGKDATIRDAGSSKVVTFSLACEKVKKANEEKAGTDWFKVDFWGKRAEGVAQYLKQGTQVFVTGRFELETFTKQDGTQGHSLQVTANDIKLLARPQGAAAQQQAPVAAGARPAVAPPPVAQPTASDWDAVFGSDEQISF